MIAYVYHHAIKKENRILVFTFTLITWTEHVGDRTSLDLSGVANTLLSIVCGGGICASPLARARSVVAGASGRKTCHGARRPLRPVRPLSVNCDKQCDCLEGSS